MNDILCIKNDTYGVTVLDGVPVVSSRIIAENFKKRHDNVLRDIKNIIDSLLKIEEPNWEKNFIPSQYKDRGKKYSEYLLTRDGFTLLAMGFTGKKAILFKIAYINRFNEMEQFILNRSIARLEYPALTDAIKMMHEEPKFYHYSNEADLINRIVLGMSAREFRQIHGLAKGETIRNCLTHQQLEAIQALQRADVGFVVAISDFKQRKEVLKAYYERINKKLLPAATS